MENQREHRRRRPSSYLLAFVLLLVTPPASSWANDVQFHICSAAQNLGTAAGRLEIFGRLDIPAQREELLINVANAENHIAAAESLVEQPFSTSPDRQRAINQIRLRLQRFPTGKASGSLAMQINEVNGIASAYMNTLHFGYVSSDPGTFVWDATCDSNLFEANRNLARAQVASAADEMVIQTARGYQANGNNSARRAIQSGLQMSIDGIPPDARNSIKRKLCYFNTKENWDATVPDLQSNTPWDTYKEFMPEVLELCRGAGAYHDRERRYSVWRVTDFGGITPTGNHSGKVATYSTDSGRIIGSASDTTISGFWVEKNSREPCSALKDGSQFWGRVELVRSGDTVTGSWSYCDKPLSRPLTGSAK